MCDRLPSQNSTVVLDDVRTELVDVIMKFRIDNESQSIFYTKVMNNRQAKGNILFLADQPIPRHGSQSLALAPEIMYLGYSVFQTDISLSYSRKGHLTTIQIDHMKPFPFERGFFDIILMRRGLCCCDDLDPTTTCGGIPKTPTQIAGFLLRVITVLNTSNPRACAYLEGYNDLRFNDSKHSTTECLNFWVEAASLVNQQCDDAIVRIILDKSKTRFYSYHILPKIGLDLSR